MEETSKNVSKNDRMWFGQLNLTLLLVSIVTARFDVLK